MALKNTIELRHRASFPSASVSPESSAELVVVHLRFTLPGPPQTRHLIGVLDDKLPVVSLPGDDVVVLLFPQQLQDEVPQLDLSGARARLRLVGPIRKGKPWGGRTGEKGASERNDHQRQRKTG